jgi:hypothetical protein
MFKGIYSHRVGFLNKISVTMRGFSSVWSGGVVSGFPKMDIARCIARG